MPPEALSLDFCGTLAVERSTRAAIYAGAARARGLAVDEAAMGRLMAETHDALPRELNGAFRYTDGWFQAFIERIFHGALGLQRAALPDVERELFARFSDAATFRVFPGAPDLLAAARRAGVRTLVVSNWSPRLPALLAGMGLTAHLDAVVCSAAERLEKPDPALFLRALERVGVAPGRALHAGDHPERDVAGARRAGLEAVLVDHSGTMAGAAEGAARVRSLDELRARLELE